MTTQQDSAAYLEKKRLFSRLFTVYGRKPVLEILKDKRIDCFRLHLAQSNKQSNAIMRDIITLAQQRHIETLYHERQALSRISKNSQQDQGVCIDIHCPAHQQASDFLEQYKTSIEQHKSSPQQPLRLLALDRVTNPQNMGMIIRSACAGAINGIVIPEKGCAKLDAMVIKASTGTLFKAPLLRCKQLQPTLAMYQQAGIKIAGLSSHAPQTINEFQEPDHILYVLGNETTGVSQAIEDQCDVTIAIPMNNGVESLNVAVTASLLAFKPLL